jgi:hypothetical protein
VLMICLFAEAEKLKSAFVEGEPTQEDLFLWFSVFPFRLLRLRRFRSVVFEASRPKNGASPGLARGTGTISGTYFGTYWVLTTWRLAVAENVICLYVLGLPCQPSSSWRAGEWGIYF